MASSVMNHSVDILKTTLAQQDSRQVHNWKDSIFSGIEKLEKNNVGVFGETLFQSLCERSSIPSDVNGTKTKKRGGGDGDGIVNGFSVEVKTAMIGNSGTFQHELGEIPYKYNKFAFIDIEPTGYYLTILDNNLTEEQYKNGGRFTAFPNKKITWRKEKGAFKFDTSPNLNIFSMSLGYSIFVNQETEDEKIFEFIRSRFYTNNSEI
jgi:hypothetical protein